MIREKPQDFLDILKSYVPDLQKPAGAARQEFSEFFAEFQTEERPEVEQVAIRSDLRGVWCSVPEAVPDRTLLFFHGGGFSVGSTADHLGFCAELHVPLSPGSSRSITGWPGAYLSGAG